jgi:3-phenylpropionate/trans-cinnamate dioxygenase ferredoxin reductase component
MQLTNIPSVVVIGAGQAAGEFAISLRSEGYTHRISLIGDEPHLPYQRPPLSKSFLSGDIKIESLYVKPPAAFQKAQIEFVPNTRVASVNRAGRCVVAEDGRSFSYDKLVFATGGRPRQLSLPDLVVNRPPNLHYLRTVSDVEAIRSQFQPGIRLVIVGGGYIGLEVAAVARKKQIDVTVIEAMPRVLQRVTAPELSAFYSRVHREAGVRIFEGVSLRGFEYGDGGQITAVHTGDCAKFEADMVIVGIGLVPNVEIAAEAGLEIDNGISVDEHGRASAPDIFAIGDCSSHPNAYAGKRLRLESVPSALEQARSTAAFIAGRQRPYTAVPWFWSDQYDLKLQMAGLNSGYDELVIRGSPEQRSFLAFYLKAGTVLAVDSVNRLKEFSTAKRLVEQRVRVERAHLADESKPLKELLL